MAWVSWGSNVHAAHSLGKPLATESWYLLKQPAKLEQAAQTILAAYHTNTAKTVPQILHFSRESKLYLAFFVWDCERVGFLQGEGIHPVIVY